MKIFKKIIDIQDFLSRQQLRNRSVGMVPTMGALHSGHMRLLSQCKSQCEISVVSIFVNPTQFNNKKDLEKYPRSFEKDAMSLIGAGCDVLFYPDVEQMYPAGAAATQYDLGRLETLFEGAYRPGHFQGVCTVVDKLFSIVQPHKVFFGQKDYQQCMVIKRLLELKPGFSDIEMNIIPTMRETDGLAMSSRNMRLSTMERSNAVNIYKTLLWVQQNIHAGDTSEVMKDAAERLKACGFEVEYVAVADAQTLEPVNYWNRNTPLVALIAAYIGDVRLIDNLVLTDLES